MSRGFGLSRGQPKVQSRQFNFDLDKISKAINSGIVSFPRGLKGARQQFLRDDNKRLGNWLGVEQYHATECVRGLIHG